MKLGLLADIHADLTALTIALTILQREKVDLVLCAGDVVEKGVDGNAVIALMREQGIPTVRGNHDEMAVENQRRMSQNIDANGVPDQQRTLTPEGITYLQQLPFALRFQMNNQRVLLVHGSLESNWDYLYAHTPAAKFITLAHDAEADIIIGGHTHVPMHIKTSAADFINPGSVCDKTTQGSYTCATLSLPDVDLRVFDLKTGKTVDYAYHDYARLVKQA